MDNDLDALRRQLQQLKDLHEAGTLGADAYDSARTALEQRIVALVMQAPAAAPASTPAAPKLPRALVLGVGAATLVLAIGGYLWTGSPQLALAPVPASVATAASGAQGIGQAEIEAMVGTLQQRLQEQPDDAEGWLMLGRSYAVLGRHAEAVPAYRRSLALRPNDAALLSDMADALAMVNGRSLAGEPTTLVEQALKLDPDNMKALSLAGSAAFDRSDYATAVKHWERVAALAAPDSPWLPRVRESIAEARSRGGMPPAAAVAAAPPAATAGPNASGAAGTPGATIRGTVTLAAALRAKAAPEDTVFVFARPAEGPRMPLAIVRKQVKDLPFEFVLDDTTAMSPASRLSTQTRVVVSARISKSGDAMPQPGDLSGQSAPLALDPKGNTGLRVEIGQVVTP
ncbi:c-type cytochrome biogenesis protein CcmI [Rubrivivax sp. RP6-9]|uniref:c-type cytochrome biogenesis protein CcmI n=1 Tax=Rubrivivax sp. RP6-9 TaxID=3415750 RepID=UPI003CC5A7D5